MEANTQGIPMVRSFMMNFPDDKNGRAITDQFMLGALLLKQLANSEEALLTKLQLI